MATEGGRGPRGAYLTKNKAEALEARIDDLEHRVDGRLARLERGLSTVLEFPIELAKRSNDALLDAVQTFTRKSGGGGSG